MEELILGFKSVFEIFTLLGAISETNLTAESAFLFPFITMWLGTLFILLVFIYI